MSSRPKLAIDIISALFIFLFTYTAINKLLQFGSFKKVLAVSPLTSNWAGIAASCILLLEGFTVLLLLYPPVRVAGIFLSFLLMVLFSSYILIMLVSSSHLPCSCGGILKELTWRNHLYLNIFLTILAGLAMVLEIKRRKTMFQKSG